MTDKTITVLLIDDDAEYVNVIRHLLRPFQNHHFTILWNETGDNLTEFLKAHPGIDVILMDYFLPSRNGLEITKQLFDEKAGIPIIFLTANKDFKIAVEAMKYGVEDYLLKDEVIETTLPRTVLNVIERTGLKKRISEAQNSKFVTQKRTDAVRELVVTMCHEFNNPLAAIKISADILVRQGLPENDRDLLTRLNSNISLFEQQIIKLRDLNIEG